MDYKKLNMIKNFKEFQSLQESLEPIEFLTPQQIEWCNKHIEGKWSVNENGEVTVEQNVKFKDTSFTRFEVQFADTDAEDSTNIGFYCEDCINLTSLEGAPKNVEVFDCSGCTSLTTLQGAPQEVVDFNCSGCTSLTTLEGAPKKGLQASSIRFFFLYDCTKLTSLEGAPQKVDWFNCENCTSLTTLQGAPQEVNDFKCDNCTNLNTIKWVPSKINKFSCEGCPKLNPDEVKLFKEDLELYKKWLASGISFNEWKEKKRGMITGKKYGL